MFLYKPIPDSPNKPFASFLSPRNLGGLPTITGSDGRVYTGRPANEYGFDFNGSEGFQYLFPQDVLGVSNATINYGGMTGRIGSGRNAYEGDSLANWMFRQRGSAPGAPGNAAGGGGQGGNAGAGGTVNPEGSGNTNGARPPFTGDIDLRGTGLTPGTPEYNAAIEAEQRRRGAGGSNNGGANIGNQGGVDFVIPSNVDFSQLVAPFVDFGAAFDFAQGVGRDNADTYYRNLTSERSRNAALGLVDTDIEGINRGLDAFIPRIRAEGQRDLETNISRGSQLDAFNFSRIPGFNAFNRGEIAANNEFNRGERAKSIAASGIDYQSRLTKVLDQLSDQSEGRFSDDLLDTLLTRTNRDRGADISAASGINSSSGAGINIQDKQEIRDRLSMAQNAQQLIPSVATQAQSVLQPPEELAQAIKAQPTQVPLNPSNIADRIPIQSSISAGAAQQNIANRATDIEIIPATTALTSRLNTEQFNETGAYNRDISVLDRQQGQLQARDSATQTAINQGVINDQNAQQQRNFEAVLEQQREIANLQAGTQAGGILGTFLAPIVKPIIESILGSGTTTPPQQEASPPGQGGIFEETESIIDSVINPPSLPGAPQTPIAGGGGGGDSAGGGGGGFFDYVENEAGEFFETVGENLPFGRTSGDSVALSRLSGQNASLTPNSGRQLMQEVVRPLNNFNQDFQAAAGAANAANNWNQYNTGEQIRAVANPSTAVLENAGALSNESGKNVRTAMNSFGTFFSPNSTEAQRAAAGAQLTSMVANTSYGGSIDNPTTIGGSAVTGSFTGSDGQKMYSLENGQTVSRADLAATSNTLSAINTLSVLTSDAPDVDKLAALTSTGLNTAAANQILDAVKSGYGITALSLFSSSRAWGDQNDISRAASIAQNATTTFSTIANSGIAQTGANTGASVLGAQSAFETLAGFGPYVSGAIAGGYTGYNQFTGAKKFLTGKGDETNLLEQASLFSFTGGASLFPTIKNLVGGGGKSSGRQMRDQWRAGLQQSGVIDKDYQVTLADGSKYDLGKDDGAKLVNAEGVERNTFDVDWSNRTAVESIPDAHLFAISTGLDPTSHSKQDTFHRATAQTVNAATSNAKTPEQARANIKAMMKNQDPNELASRIETLRLGNKINDQEYNTYIDRINKMYGTQLKSQDRQKMTNTYISGIKQMGDQAPKEAKDFLNLLTNPQKLEEARRMSEERVRPRGPSLIPPPRVARQVGPRMFA